MINPKYAKIDAVSDEIYGAPRISLTKFPTNILETVKFMTWMGIPDDSRRLTLNLFIIYFKYDQSQI